MAEPNKTRKQTESSFDFRQFFKID